MSYSIWCEKQLCEIVDLEKMAIQKRQEETGETFKKKKVRLEINEKIDDIILQRKGVQI